MTERDKIINIVEQNKYCDVNTVANCRECKYGKELENYKDMGCSSLKTADALIAAGFGNVTEYKEIIRDLNTDVVAYRALSKADTLEQIIEGQKSLIDEYKHRTEVTERALLNLAYKIVIYIGTYTSDFSSIEVGKAKNYIELEIAAENVKNVELKQAVNEINEKERGEYEKIRKDNPDMPMWEDIK